MSLQPLAITFFMPTVTAPAQPPIYLSGPACCFLAGWLARQAVVEPAQPLNPPSALRSDHVLSAY